MNKKLLIMSVCFGVVSAAGATVNFDQGVDVKAAVNDAVVSEIKLPAAKFSQLVDITRDCKKITFGAADPLTSAEYPLTSIETTQECQNTGTPAGQICFPNTRRHYELAKIAITQPRELKPDQKEVFEVCLWGSFLSLKLVSPAYNYSVNRVLSTFELTPKGAAQPASADDKGLTKAQDPAVCTLTQNNPYSCIYYCKPDFYIYVPPVNGCSPTTPYTPSWPL